MFLLQEMCCWVPYFCPWPHTSQSILSLCVLQHCCIWYRYVYVWINAFISRVYNTCNTVFILGPLLLFDHYFLHPFDSAFCSCPFPPLLLISFFLLPSASKPFSSWPSAFLYIFEYNFTDLCFLSVSFSDSVSSPPASVHPSELSASQLLVVHLAVCLHVPRQSVCHYRSFIFPAWLVGLPAVCVWLHVSDEMNTYRLAVKFLSSITTIILFGLFTKMKKHAPLDNS